MDIFKGFDLTPNSKMQIGIQGAGALLSGWQAQRAKVDYGNKMNEIKNYEASRQKITNAFGAMENPYKNLAVATQAAEIQMEQTDQALATTLDTLRATGASAGGATALANAALKSKQGISASIEQQEVNNQKLKAQGQLQVDIAKGKGEIKRMEMQEAREVSQLDRLQSQADVLRAQQLESQNAMIAGIGGMGKAFTAGMVSQDRENPNGEGNEQEKAIVNKPTGVSKPEDKAIVKDMSRQGNTTNFGIQNLTPQQIALQKIEDENFKQQQLAGQEQDLSLNTNDDDDYINIIDLDQASKMDPINNF